MIRFHDVIVFGKGDHGHRNKLVDKMIEIKNYFVNTFNSKGPFSVSCNKIYSELVDYNLDNSLFSPIFDWDIYYSLELSDNLLISCDAGDCALETVNYFKYHEIDKFIYNLKEGF